MKLNKTLIPKALDRAYIVVEAFGYFPMTGPVGVERSAAELAEIAQVSVGTIGKAHRMRLDPDFLEKEYAHLKHIADQIRPATLYLY